MRRASARILILTIVCMAALQVGAAHANCPVCAAAGASCDGCARPAAPACCGAADPAPTPHDDDCVCDAHDTQTPATTVRCVTPTEPSAIVPLSLCADARYTPTYVVDPARQVTVAAAHPLPLRGRSPPA